MFCSISIHSVSVPSTSLGRIHLYQDASAFPPPRRLSRRFTPLPPVVKKCRDQGPCYANSNTDEQIDDPLPPTPSTKRISDRLDLFLVERFKLFDILVFGKQGVSLLPSCHQVRFHGRKHFFDSLQVVNGLLKLL